MGSKRIRGKVAQAGDKIVLKDGAADQTTLQKGSNTGPATHTLPATDSTLVGRDSTDTLTNKTVVVANNTVTTAASGNLTSTELNAALNELQLDIDTRATSTALSDHVNDATDAHDASAISSVPSGNLAATDVQAALNELQSDVDTRATATALSDHIADPADAHAASAVTNTPTGNLAATTVQGALNELQGDVDTLNTAAATFVAGPASATDNALARFDSTTGKLVQNSVITASDTGVVAGVTQLDVDNVRTDGNSVRAVTGNLTLGADGDVVLDAEGDSVRVENAQTLQMRSGADLVFYDDDNSNSISVGVPANVTTNRTPQIPDATGDFVLTSATQTLTNKDIDGGTASNSSRITVPKDTKANLDALTRKEGTLVYASDEDILYADDGTNLVPVGSGAGGSGEKNYIENPSAQTAITGWEDGANTVLLATRTSTASELPREYTTGTGIKIVAGTGNPNTEYVYYDFTLDDVDLNKKLKIQWSQKQTGSYVASDLAVIITTQADRTTALHTPETTNIPAYDGVFQTTFDSGSTATLSLVIRATTDMATDAGIVISDVIVGPGTVQIVPAIGTWQSYTSTLTGFAATPTQSLFYKRNNDSISIRGSITVAGANSGNISFTIPSGLTINTSRLGNGVDGGSAYWQVGYATVKDDNTNVLYSGTILTNNTSTNDLVFVTPDGSGAASLWGAAEPIATWAASDTIEIEITDISINEWAGAPNYAGSNDVEYAYSAGTWATGSTSSADFRYGPSGAAMAGSAAGAFTMRVGFLTDISTTDQIRIEFSENQTTWLPAIGSQLGGIACILTNDSTGSGSASSGVVWNRVSGTTNQIDVTFRRYLSIANDDSPANNWPASNAYWRVVKAKAGAAVGFGLAGEEGRAGLVSREYTETYSTTWTDNGTGPGTSGSVSIVLQRIGAFVTAYIPAFSLTTGSGAPTSMSTNTAMPAWARPTTAQRTFGGQIYANNVTLDEVPQIIIGTSGVFTIRRDPAGSGWGASLPNTGLEFPTTVTWYAP